MWFRTLKFFYEKYMFLFLSCLITIPRFRGYKIERTAIEAIVAAAEPMPNVYQVCNNKDSHRQNLKPIFLPYKPSRARTMMAKFRKS